MALLIMLAMQVFEVIASLPPLSMTELPALRQRDAASDVTFGLASYIMAITPRGTVTFSILSPFGRTLPSSTLPTGSSIPATAATPFAIASTLSAFRANLSTIDSLMPLSLAFLTSFIFSERIISLLCLSASAIERSALFLISVPATASTLEAAFALLPIFSIFIPFPKGQI